MIPQNKVNAFLQKVINETKAGKLNWNLEDNDRNEFEGDEESVGYPCVARLPPNYLRVAQVRYKYWTDEDRWSWESKIALDFVDATGKLLWRFPSNPLIVDIYERARYASSDVSSAIDSFLAE